MRGALKVTLQRFHCVYCLRKVIIRTPWTCHL